MIFNYISELISKFFIFSFKEDENEIFIHENVGKKAKLIREYPLKSANITKGNEYTITDVTSVIKPISSRCDINIDFWQIENDNKIKICVNTCFFEI